MERVAREGAPNRAEWDKVYRFKQNIRRLLTRFITQTVDTLFQVKVWFNYRGRNQQICAVKGIDGQPRFYDPESGLSTVFIRTVFYTNFDEFLGHVGYTD